MSQLRAALIWTDLAMRGGVRTFAFDCMDALPSQGVDVHVLDFAAGPVAPDPEIDARKAWIHRIVPTACTSHNALDRRARSALQAIRPNLMVFMEWVHAERVLAICPPGVPAVGLCLVDRSDPSYYRRAVELKPHLRAFAGNSRTIVRRLQEVLPGGSADIRHLPLGVEIPSEVICTDGADPAVALRLVFAQRLESQQKRARDLAPIVARLREAGLNYRLDIVGDGEDAAWLRAELAPELDSGRVVMHGALPLDRTLQLIRQAHVFLLLSAYEGMPLSLQAALAAGVVPVVTDIESGIREVLVPGENALLFPVGDAVAAAQAILRLHQHREQWSGLSGAARRTGIGFDQQASMRGYATLFRDHAGEVDWSLAPMPGAGDPLRLRLWKETPAFVHALRAGRQGQTQP